MLIKFAEPFPLCWGILTTARSKSLYLVTLQSKVVETRVEYNVVAIILRFLRKTWIRDRNTLFLSMIFKHLVPSRTRPSETGFTFLGYLVH